MTERDLDQRPYSPDEQRVADFLCEIGAFGGGDDPIGFVLAAFAALSHRRQAVNSMVEEAQRLDLP